MNNYELYHHGILGMKWGIRRFQPYGEGGYNPKHKGKEVGEAKKKVSGIKKHSDSIRSYVKDVDPVKVSNMSDRDLDDKIKRLRKERDYKQLRYDQLSNGEQLTSDVLKKSGKVLATAVAVYAGQKVLTKILGSGIGKYIVIPKK